MIIETRPIRHAAGAAAAVCLLAAAAGCAIERPATEQEPAMTPSAQRPVTPEPAGPREVATFGAGCFWCVEAVFERVEGVVSAVSGYAGGHVARPTYAQVCTGTTGHAEAVQVTYDPARVSYEELLDIFWQTHDPTTPDRQGPDVGPQYRSVIFYHDERQRDLAQRHKTRLDEAGVWDRPVVTEIVPFTLFYEAEPEHQDYFADNPGQPYCAVVIRPKVAKFERAFRAKLKDRPD